MRPGSSPSRAVPHGAHTMAMSAGRFTPPSLAQRFLDRYMPGMVVVWGNIL
ncbi:hypothetical protein [Bradyrhizobium sp. 2TAF24]|uniref:hypothetical protein n=1 Tax=Bradyrhizobium sp. 2TAF24 TaxID=3233011 RepID=UPI003F920BB5